MENKCYLVSSRGILKSCDFHSSQPISSCNSDKKYLLEMLNNMFDNMTIYVCSDLLTFFVNNILEKINKKFILVSGDSDMCNPQESLINSQINKLINSNYLIKWFSQNTTIQNHNKIKQIPIGLDYHTILNNPKHIWRLPNEGYLPNQQEMIIFKIKNQVKPFWLRNPKIYVNFTKSNDRFNDRKKVLQIIPKKIVKIYDTFIKRTVNWINIGNYAFVLSPFGNGMDCHRTWEALCLGAIPILRAPNFKKMFEELPVLIVDNWSEINEQLLINTLQNFKNINFNYNKLKLEYWVNLIKSSI